MKKKLIMTSVAALIAGASLAACGGGEGGGSTTGGGTSNQLWICAYDGGYGIEWAEELGRQFEEETGIEVHVQADTSILDRIESALRDGGDYDLYLSHDINWQRFAAQGYLAELDDLYASTVEGTNETFEQRLANSAAEVSKTTGRGGEEHYYKVCWTQGAGGFVYNMDMFEDNGWTVPTTYEELVTLCDTINNAGLIAGDAKVRPFAWAGGDRQYYWDYPIFEWWAQMAGMERVNTVFKYLGPDGKYSTGYEMFNPDTYYKEYMDAYGMWWDLIANNSDNSTPNAYSGRLLTAQSDFINGAAAMIPYAQWAKYELEQTNDGHELDFNIAMMPTPKAVASAPNYNFMVGFGDSMIIPANASNIQGAKDFIRFLARPSSCATFVEKSQGAFLAFDYSDVDMGEITANDTYIASVYNKINFENFSCVSTNPITYFNTNAVMNWPGNNYYYQNACSDPSSYTRDIVGDLVYNTARQNWETWLRNAGISPNS